MANGEEVALTIAPAEWCDEASQCFRRPGVIDYFEEVAAAVAHGAALFRVSSGDDLVGYYVLTIDGGEGLLLAASGAADGIDLTAMILPQIERQFVGCKTMRIHTRRPGLAAKLARLGWEGEMLFRKVLQCAN